MYKVLLVDDEKIVLDGLRRFVDFTGEGFEVAGQATGCDEALAFLATQPVDLVITDISMPEKSGLDLIRALRQMTPEVLTLILSAYSEFAWAQEALRLGAVDYLNKPINFDLMSESLRRVKARLDEQARKSRLDSVVSALELPREADASGEMVERVKRYLEAHFSQNITLETLAAAFFVSPVYLSRLFKKKTGQNYVHYLTLLRMRRALTLLATTDLKVAEIAELIGYENPRYFARLFKNHTGDTPQAYREKRAKVSTARAEKPPL